MLGVGMGVQVAEEDLKRVASATGASVQTTVNNLNPKVLGTCANFEEVQASPASHLPHSAQCSADQCRHVPMI